MAVLCVVTAEIRGNALTYGAIFIKLKLILKLLSDGRNPYESEGTAYDTQTNDI